MRVLYLDGVSCQGEGEEFSEKEKNQRLQDETHGNREEKNPPENEEKSETLPEEFVEIETVGGGVLHAGIVPHAAGNARGRGEKSEDFSGAETGDDSGIRRVRESDLRDVETVPLRIPVRDILVDDRPCSVLVFSTDDEHASVLRCPVRGGEMNHVETESSDPCVLDRVVHEELVVRVDVVVEVGHASIVAGPWQDATHTRKVVDKLWITFFYFILN